MIGAATAGRFIGAVLAECGPVIYELGVRIIRDANKETMVVADRDDDLRDRLVDKLRQSHSLSEKGNAGEISKTN